MKHKRYEALDACRGVAAILVVCYHFGTLERHGTIQYFPYGFLAVDFFFVLSGFVIDKTYSEKLANGLPFTGFLARRLVRLYPLYLLGQFFGLGRQVVGIMMHEPRALSVLKVASAFAFGLFMFPSPFPGRHMFALNSPSWSIFYELAANIVFAILVFRLSRKALLILFGAAFIILCVQANATGQINDFGQSWAHALPGISRVTFGFLVGVAVSRCTKRPPKLTNAAYATVVCIVAFIGLPQMTPSSEAGSFYSLLFIGILAPFCVMFGARFDCRSGLSICRFLGAISYPLYIIHPFLTDPTILVMQRFGMSAACGTVLYVTVSVTAAALIYLIYDLPTGRLLQKLQSRQRPSPQAEIVV